MNIFSPLSLRSVTLRNRIGVSPMCQYSAEDGHLSDWHLVHLGSRAIGGAGLVMVEATAVAPEGRISIGDSGLWSESQIEPLIRIGKFVNAHGGVLGLQIAHAGRKASCEVPWNGGAHLDDEHGGWQPVAPSSIAFGGTQNRTPRPLTTSEIQGIVQDFRRAAIRAREAGVRLLEIHAAHGYLIHEFLSPLSNKREDSFGGSFENRTRFALQVVESVRSVWPDSLPLAVRLSCTDWVEGGWTLEESVDLSRRLKIGGVDVIDCSSGAIVPGTSQYPTGPGWQVGFAERIRSEVGISTFAVGMITDPVQANRIILNNQADGVLLAREMLRNPYWPMHAAVALGEKDKLPSPTPYLRSWYQG